VLNRSKQKTIFKLSEIIFFSINIKWKNQDANSTLQEKNLNNSTKFRAKQKLNKIINLLSFN
jgi:hypothetical protein